MNPRVRSQVAMFLLHKHGHASTVNRREQFQTTLGGGTYFRVYLKVRRCSRNSTIRIRKQVTST